MNIQKVLRSLLETHNGVIKWFMDFWHDWLASLHPWHDDRLGLGPECGDDGGGDLAHVGDDGEREWDADDGEEDAEDPAAGGDGRDVAVAHGGDDGGREEDGLHVGPLERGRLGRHVDAGVHRAGHRVFIV